MKTAQANLDEAVRQAYGMKKSDDRSRFFWTSTKASKRMS